MIEKTVKIAGKVVFWTLDGETDRDKLVAELATIGIPEDVAPKETTPITALKRALHRIFRGNNVLIRRLPEEEGYAVFRETPDGENLKHDEMFRYALLPGNQLGLRDLGLADPADLKLVTGEFFRQRKVLPREAASKFLVHMVGTMDSVALRENGGFYWIPNDKTVRWGGIANCVARAACNGGTTIYALSTVHDAESFEAIGDALKRETMAEVNAMNVDLANAKYGEIVADRREADVLRLEAKVKRYAGVVNSAMPEVTASLEKVRAVAASVRMQAIAKKSLPKE